MHEILKVYLYDSPDGKNCLIKTAKCAQVGTVWGLLAGATDAALYTNCTTLGGWAARLAHFGVPGAATGAMLAATSCLVGEVRGENDPLNHLIGGFAAGSVWGAKYRSVSRGVSVACAGAVLAGLYKLIRDAGYTFTGTTAHPGHKEQGPYAGRHFLFSKETPEPKDRY